MNGWDYASKRSSGRFAGGFRLGYRHEHSCKKTIEKYLDRPFGSFSRSCVGKFKKMNPTLSATQVYAKIAADPEALWCDDCRKRDGVPFQRLAAPIDIKRLDAKKAFVRYGARGAGLDLKTLYHALFDESVSLEQAARNLRTEHQKTHIETYGVVTPESLDYCMNDTLVTCDVLWKLVAELERHPIDLEPEHAYSPASVAKAYLRAMGIDKPAPLDTSALQ